VKVFIGGIVIVLGFIAFYFLWPQSIDLPTIGTVKEWPLKDVYGDDLSTKEKPMLITFFFTNCPDICPTTMRDLTDLQPIMMEKGIADDQYVILSVTLDPETDTIEKIIQYKELLDISSSNWLFLRGSVEETKRFTQFFNFYYEEEKGGFFTHATSMYIVDAKGQIRAHHDMTIGEKQVNIEQIADHLKKLIN